MLKAYLLPRFPEAKAVNPSSEPRSLPYYCFYRITALCQYRLLLSNNMSVWSYYQIRNNIIKYEKRLFPKHNFYKIFRIGTELTFIGTVLRLNRISVRVKMVLLKVFSFHSTFTGCCFLLLAHGRYSRNCNP